MDVAVVGGGLAGLTAAYHLRRHGVDAVVLEGSERVGGVLGTTWEDGYLLEHAAHAMPGRAAALRRLAGDLHVDLVEARPASKERFMVHHGRLVPLPASPVDLIRTPLLPVSGKLRLAKEPFVPTMVGDESVHAFATRRFGDAVAPLVDALATGVYAGHPARLSVRHAFPSVTRLVHEHGSVLKGAVRGGGGAPRGLFAPRGGMGTLVDALAAEIPVRTGVRVTRVTRDGEGHALTTSAGPLQVRGVVLANGPAAGALLEEDWPPVPRAPVTVVGLGFAADDVDDDGYGFIAPEAEGRFALGCLFESSLFPGRAPEGHALLRVLVGGARHPERAHMEDDPLIANVLNDLWGLGVAEGDPTWRHVVRHPHGIPQPEVGHGRFLGAVAQAETTRPGLVVTGAGVAGVGVGDLVEHAADAAARLTSVLRS